MTREQRKRARRLRVIAWVALYIIAAVVLTVITKAAFWGAENFDPESYKTALACIGAVSVVRAFWRLINRLEVAK